MHLLLKFVLITVFAVNCYSYDIPDPELPEEDSSYPHDYIEKVMSELSSEELEQLKINHNQIVEKRIGDLPGTCESTSRDMHPLHAFDENNILYYVVQSDNENKSFHQMFSIEICNNPDCNALKGYIGCCKQQDELVEMTVLSVPVKDFKPSDPQGDFVQKKMNLKKAKCICKEYPDIDSADCKSSLW